MADAFKLMLDHSMIQSMARHFATHAKQIGCDFAHDDFIAMAAQGLDKLELKQRSNQIVAAMKRYLPADFSTSAQIITASLAPEKSPSDSELLADDQGLTGWAIMPMADYVGQAGVADFSTAMDVFKALTKRFSAEFGIRYFLTHLPKDTLAVLGRWCEDECPHVRRLVSEGTRPRLPWGMRLSEFVRDPSPILPLLEKLKDDPEEYVRRSVANNLNDIAKDHPDLVAQQMQIWWDGCSLLSPAACQSRQRLIRHACRTLLKQGHSAALAIFGYKPPQLDEIRLSIDPQTVVFGEKITFHLQMTSICTQPQALIIDYAVHFVKANQKTNAKVFKWKTCSLAANETRKLSKSHSFKAVTTRVYYPGEHHIEILINGKSMSKKSFLLIQD